MEELLNELNLDIEPTKLDANKYEIDLDNSNEYAKMYSMLNNSEIVKEDIDSSQLTSDTSSLQFTANNLTVTLLADFNADTYKMILREN